MKEYPSFIPGGLDLNQCRVMPRTVKTESVMYLMAAKHSVREWVQPKRTACLLQYNNVHLLSCWIPTFPRDLKIWELKIAVLS